MVTTIDVKESLIGQLRGLHLPTFRESFEQVARRAERAAAELETAIARATSATDARTAGEAAVLPVHGGAAHLARDGLEQAAPVLEHGIVEVPDLHRDLGLRHDGGADGHAGRSRSRGG